MANTVIDGGKSSDTGQNGMTENNGVTPEQQAYQEMLEQMPEATSQNTDQGGERRADSSRGI